MVASDTNNLSRMDQGSGICPLPVALALGQSLGRRESNFSSSSSSSSTCVRAVATCSHGSWDRREREWDGDLSSYNSTKQPDI